MRVSEAFPSNYIKAGDLQGGSPRVVINHVKLEDIGDDRKPVVYFKGKEKGLVLNKTNANNIATLFGDDMDDWSGKEIVLFPAMVDFQGRTVEAIRVRGVQAKDRPAAKPDPNITTGPRKSSADMHDDEIGF